VPGPSTWSIKCTVSVWRICLTAVLQDWWGNCSPVSCCEG